MKDFSSEDSQELIREYTTLIHEIIKEFEQLVKENNDLKAELEATKSILEIKNKTVFEPNLNTSQSNNLLVENKAFPKQTSLEAVRIKFKAAFHLQEAFIKSLGENGLETTIRKVISKLTKFLDRSSK